MPYALSHLFAPATQPLLLLEILLALAVSLTYFARKIKKDLHIFQLNSYFIKRYWCWIKNKLLIAFKIKDIASVFLLLIFIVLPESSIAFSAFAILNILLIIFSPKTKEKKPLNFTPRATRLYLVSLAIYLFLGIYFAKQILLHVFTFKLLLALLITLQVLCTLSPFILMLSNLLLLPVEKIINCYYLHDAKKILKSSPNLTIIGITGSFGKTSTKHILFDLLKNKFNTLMTPGSYNTLLGICKVIRGELKKHHEVFLVEMSAKEKGNIKEICDLVRPTIGIITSIGEQHLETFKTLENIKSTKNELIEALPADGLAIFNYDDQNCRDLAKLTSKKTIFYGCGDSNALDYSASNISFNNKGTTFNFHNKKNESCELKTKLLGKYNIYNILAALTVSQELGLNIQELIYPVSQLKAAAHRLEIKKMPNGVTIIDDAFNANPKGAEMALATLKQVEGGKKIIVTPGFIELGSLEYSANYNLGQNIADVCDQVILVGAKQTSAIQEGLKNKSYPKNQVVIAENLAQALSYLQQTLEKNDVVLFENDLPDNYNEQ